MKKLIAVGNDHENEIIRKLTNAGFKFRGKSDCRKLYARDNTLVMIITIYPVESWE